MNRDVYKYLKMLSPNISEEEIKATLSLGKIVNLKKKEVIVDKGEIAEDYFFLISGLVRKYYIDEKGKKHIRSFYGDLTLFSPAVSLISQEPNKYIFDCLEDSKFLALNYKKHRKLCEKYPRINATYVRTLEKALLLREERISDLTSLNATERYLKLKKEFNNIENLVAQYHIASYLNITPVQLSRIRRELYSR